MAAKSIKPVSINGAVLNDLASRFLLNIPREDQDDPMKLCTHIELAYWFYLDLVRPEDSTLPGCSMKEFMAAIFKHCPFLVKDSVMVDLDNYVAQWKAHKYKKPVRGGIILNQDWTKCLLVQGYPASTTWGFPKGKLEEGENDIDAAVRELYEETGFDSRGIIKEKWHLVAQVNGSEAKMYIIPGVPDNTNFEPKTRKEIRSIQWFRIDDLPRHRKDLTSKQALGKSANSFFMIIPFISQLRKWIASNSKSSARASKGKTISAHFQNPVQQQSHSKSSVPQRDSKPASPSAPPLDVISHHYGMGYGNETRMGYGGMGTYNAPYSGTEMHNYQSNHPRPIQQPPTTTATSRDDTAPIPYPPQHPHSLHPNHTLPAPLQHSYTTTGPGYYSHNAVYPSHLMYTNNMPAHAHHPHHQQMQLHHQHHQQSPHVPRGHILSTTTHVMHPPHPPPAFPIAPADSGPRPGSGPGPRPWQLSPQVHHQMPAAIASNQHPQYYQDYHAAAAVPPVHTCTAAAMPVHNVAAARQLFPSPSTTSTTMVAAQYPHYHNIHSSVQPKTQEGQQQLYNYGRVSHQPVFQTQDRTAAGHGQHVPHQQVSRNNRNKDDKEVNATDIMARLKLGGGEGGGGASQHHSLAPHAGQGEAGKDGHGYRSRVVLKPAANMVGFKFNTEAILKASNVKFKT